MRPIPVDIPRGVALCLVTLVDVQPTEEVRGTLSAKERAFDNYDDGRFVWKLENPVVLPEPVPMRGWQRLWNVDTSLFSEAFRHWLKSDGFDNWLKEKGYEL